MADDLDMHWHDGAGRSGLYLRGGGFGGWVALIVLADLRLTMRGGDYITDPYERMRIITIPHTLTDLGEVKALAESLVRMRHEQ